MSADHLTPIHPEEKLKDFFLKNELIKMSIKSIQDDYANSVKRIISHHSFNHPLKCDIQSDPEQVAITNKIFGTNKEFHSWTIPLDPNVTVDIDENNKREIISNMISKIYLLLSIQLFENTIDLIKEYVSNGKKLKTSLHCLAAFHEEFASQLESLNKEKVNYKSESTILILQNLRIFRNRITHGQSTSEDLIDEIIKYNENIKNLELKDYSPFRHLGELSRSLYFYKFVEEELFLDRNGLLGLVNLYSQLGYLCYCAYCKKNGLSIIIT